jgi:hypothetical protein
MAILLVGGDKSGDWKGWYDTNIPVADDRFDEDQANLETRRTEKAATSAPKTTRTKRAKRR